MIELSLKQIAAGLAARQFSSVELTQTFLDRIAALNPAAQRLHHRRPRWRAGSGPGRRSAPRLRRSRSADRDPDRTQGSVLHRRAADQLRLEDARELHQPLRRDRCRAAQGGRHRAAGQDQLRRVRDGFDERELGFRCGEEPLGSLPRTGGLFRWFGRGGRGASRTGDHRHRYRRVDSPARLAVRRDRPEADLRCRVALGHGGLRFVARSGGAVREERRGLRADAQRFCRFR